MSLKRIRTRMREQDIDCVIITEESNFVYTLDESASGYLFVTQDKIDIVASNFYLYDLEGFSPEYAYSREDYQELLDERANKYEGNIVADTDSEGLKERFGAEKTDFMGEVRQIKTADEIERIREACEITDRAFEKARESLFSGLTEWEAYSVLSQHYSENGVQDAFLTNKGQSIVQRNSLRPHRPPNNKEIRSEDMVIIDTGARYQHYCADVTRTYCENPSESQIELFEAVKQIQEELIDMVEPGVSVGKIQEKEHALVEEHGYDVRENVLHLPGHSLGIEAHEKPSLSMGSETEFEKDMVVAVEPGLYVPGAGGCRIEDTVLVTQDGAERLSEAPREL